MRVLLKAVNSQQRIPWFEPFGHRLICPEPQRPATISSDLGHSIWYPYSAYIQPHSSALAPAISPTKVKRISNLTKFILCFLINIQIPENKWPSQQSLTTLYPSQSNSAPDPQVPIKKIRLKFYRTQTLINIIIIPSNKYGTFPWLRQLFNSPWADPYFIQWP